MALLIKERGKYIYFEGSDEELGKVFRIITEVEYGKVKK